MADTLLFIVFRGFVGALNVLPYRLRLAAVCGIFALANVCTPRYRRVAHRNLSLAFPQSDTAWRNSIIGTTKASLAQVFVDFIRIPALDRAWAETHVDFPQRERFEEFMRQNSGKGTLFVAGHLGSFELLPMYMALMYHPMSLVAREFKSRKIDTWWNSVRSCRGNTVISRGGALKGILKALREGKVVGLLFDQNVRRDHAVFVDWFGRPAATTKGLGMAALRTEAPILIFAMYSLPAGRYRIEMRECDCGDIYASAGEADYKIREITRRAVVQYEDLIRKDPPAWFWMHRRWRTTENPDAENFYAGI